MDQNSKDELRTEIRKIMHEYGLDDPDLTRRTFERTVERHAFYDAVRKNVIVAVMVSVFLAGLTAIAKAVHYISTLPSGK